MELDQAVVLTREDFPFLFAATQQQQQGGEDLHNNIIPIQVASMVLDGYTGVTFTRLVQTPWKRQLDPEDFQGPKPAIDEQDPYR